MRVIDAHTGNELKVGHEVWNGHDRTYRVQAIEPGLFSARMQVVDQTGKASWIPLQVRWTHPRFFLQHVAFVPS